MPTWTAVTTLTDKAVADILSDACEGLTPEPTGVGVYEVEDGSGIFEVSAYFTEAPDEIGLALLAAVHGGPSFVVTALPETDWIATVKQALPPIVAGRFFLYGSHDADKVPQDCVALLVEAALAFGSGHHGTTWGCLQALHNLAAQGFVGKNVVDIGCGTAVLAMAAAKIWPGVVLASDIDAVATETAAANALSNDLAGRIAVVTCAGFEHETLRSTAPYDLIFANILKGPLMALAPDMGANCANLGYIILSGILNEQADDIKQAYGSQGFSVEDHLIVGDWSTLCLRKTG
jgi:ribosomal protein L11 methyltransferase